jgi:hypothetical protein
VCAAFTGRFQWRLFCHEHPLALTPFFQAAAGAASAPKSSRDAEKTAFLVPTKSKSGGQKIGLEAKEQEKKLTTTKADTAGHTKKREKSSGQGPPTATSPQSHVEIHV